VPVYEYRCHDCARRVSLFWRTFSEAEKGTPRCPLCDGKNLERLMSRVRVIRSEESVVDDMADLGDLPDENDPTSLGKWMRKMGGDLGEDLGPEFDEVVGRLEAGESPEKIEEAMPDLMGEGGDDLGIAADTV
jgi:putative FmdB family regulatory protein